MKSFYETLKEHAANYESVKLTLDALDDAIIKLYKNRPTTLIPIGQISGIKNKPKMQITYPFGFNELLLTSKLLDVLGFSEYWAGCGEFGDRSLDLGGKVGDERLTSIKEYPRYYIHEIDETPDPSSGYGISTPSYSSCYFTNKDFQPLYFLHDMYEDILKRRTPEEVATFIKLLKQSGINMYNHIESYLTYKNKQNG